MTAVQIAVFRLLVAAIFFGFAFVLLASVGVDLGFIGESVSDLVDRVAG